MTARAHWRFRGGEAPHLSPALIKAAGDSRILARLLLNRGLQTPQAMRAFLDMDAYAPTDPAQLPDFAPALARLRQAIDGGEAILVFGDFDVDGQTGTAIFTDTLRHLGANFSAYIPDRASEGHGLNATALCRLVSARGLKLVVTTDTGITNFKEVSLLRGLGVDTIVTDHHDPPEQIPPAVANVNPKLLQDAQHPLYHMCGAGVAYKLCQALLSSYEQADFAETLLDLAALGTVVDMMPLLQENRWLVWRGLQVMNANRRPGIAALLAQAGASPEASVTSETLGFTIGPRLNAVGRLERADEAVELLTSADPERCRIIAARFEALNRKRQELCERTVLDAERYVVSHGALDGQRALILANADWHPGIIGLAATRLKEKFSVPVFLLIPDAAKREARCSARSIDGFPLMERLSELSHYFLHAGGHAGAGGFALPLDRLEAFKNDLYALAARTITDEMLRPTLEVDERLDWEHLTPGLITIIDRMRPFGQANPSPLFLVENIAIAGQKTLGESGDHLKLILAPSDAPSRTGPPAPNQQNRIEGLIWGFGRSGAGARLDASHPWSLVASAEQNDWRGQQRLQLIIRDYAPAGSTDARAQRSQSAAIAPNAEGPPAQRNGHERNASSQSPAVTAPARAQTEKMSAQEEEGPTIWLDHRSREGVESFVGQLMLPLQEGRSVALYHEGRAPQIPFLDEGILCGRETLRAAQELVFWDLPPDPATFRHVMESVQPSMVHLVGGKYQSAPVFPPARDLARLTAMAIRHLAGERPGDPIALSTPELAQRLATTPAVIVGAVALLARLNQLVVAPLGEDGPKTLSLQALPTLDPASIPEGDTLTSLLEYHALRHSLSQVSRYRHWLLSAPMEAIKTLGPLAPDLFSLAAREPAQTVSAARA
ncbi:MAG: single-stranded-DNA-specific exonuclease RecJ [Vampirovibrionales bacterium]|nr:single-stranded-DNA-specific exonuclease RecJ [Vampirovibrionales bacterium]